MYPAWLDWTRRLQAIAQTGLTYAADPYDVERYEQIRAIAAEIAASHSDAGLEYIQGLFADQAGYATPKVDVRGAVFRDDAILLVKERSDGGWTLPGGWADVGDSPSDAVVREIAEESGYQTRAIKLLAFYDRNRHGHPPYPFHAYKIFFLCELSGGAAATSAETEEVGFFREDALPELSLTRVMPSQIARLFAHYRHPEWPTDFD
ncbi:MAG TPA: NUDIX hydrolase [Roseiflexaceae bacterium]|nr:NUDIX hydrolase [Roseiflexaceae bacterium]